MIRLRLAGMATTSDDIGGLVTYACDGTVATVTLDDGKVNVLSPAMLDALGVALDRASADGAAVVLTGRPRILSAGFDLGVLAGGGEAALRMVQGGFLLAERLLRHPAPVVVACPGNAVAMGAFLLAAGDYVVGTAGPYRYQANEVALGLTMPHAAVALLRRRLAPAAFDRAVGLSEAFTPAAGLAAGWVDLVVEAEDLAGAAHEAAATFAALDRPAHAASKLRARAGVLAELRAGIEADEAEVQLLVGA
jgi:enoyl-CoA hydratase